MIVVVDDEPNIRETAAFILEMEGFSVVKACNGEEGLEYIRQFKPKLILLDVMMPKMDGYTLCHLIKHDPELSKIFVVMLTAKGQKVDEQKAHEMGADAYMTKPFDAEEVVWYLRKVFDETKTN
ncbi:response regulator [candidate division KSB1 bacterium]|nr:response regulator [candidate division KSB1 bacterium]